ncbi:MAG: phenylalanine--tRNA ligase subunit beta [Thermoguttaceae bacterium]
MYISLDWISDYVDLSGLSTDEIVSRLTLATAEVEDFKQINRSVRGVLIGEITKVEKIDDKRTFCHVNCGSNVFTTVCGAPNVRVGLKSAFAPAGTILAGDKKIDESDVSGKKSQGILCSAAELGMSNWHEIILECPSNLVNGTPLSNLIPENDILIEIDNKSLTHRPDLWGHYGFAREFAAIFHRPFKALPQRDLSEFDALPAYPLENDDLENCPCYGCIEFETKTPGAGRVPSPLVMQRRLHSLGLRTYNLLVDVTNYVNWEIGQPTHAFDAEKLGGIKVAPLGKAGTFVTLDGQERKLLQDDLLIWGGGAVAAKNEPSKADVEKTDSPKNETAFRPVALAGIMGGLETEITDSTTKMLLESANFKAARIRKTSGRLDLRTDASQRFEKSQPPYNVIIAVARILKLLDEAGVEWTASSRFTVAGDLKNSFRAIELPAGRLEKLSGIALSQSQVLGILHSLGFDAKYDIDQNLHVGVPPFRSEKDISIPEDIVEEVLRIFGFDNIQPILPNPPISPIFIEKTLKMGHKARKILATAHKFLEVHNYIWFNDLWLKTIQFEPGETLILRNPTAPESARIRTTLLPMLFSLVPKNRPFRDSFRLFELGRTFFPTGKKEECIERQVLAGISFQQNGSLEQCYLALKAAVEDMFKIGSVSGVTYHDGTQTKDERGVERPWLVPGSFAEIRVLENMDNQAENQAKKLVGTIGVLDKSMMSKVSPEGGQVAWFEISLDLLHGHLYPPVTFIEPPRFPLSWLDFSLLWNVEEGFEKLQHLLDKFTHPLIVRREFLVVYKGKGIDKGVASYSFRYWIGAADHTLSGDDIESFHKQFLEFIHTNGVSLRG